MKPAVARPALVHALALGVAADLLLHEGPDGAGFSAWIAILAISATALVWRIGRNVPREARAWLTTAVLFAAGVAWRNSAPLLEALNVLATGGSLAMAAVSLRLPAWSLLHARLRDALWALFRVALATAAGILPVALRARLDSRSSGTSGRDYRAIVRAAAISTVLLVVFGSLLLSADPIFAALLAIPRFDVARVVSHVVVFGFFAWIVAGWTRGALDDEPVAPVPEGFGFSLSALDITMSLGVLNALFAAYLGAQLTWFFGGETYLQAQTGLTASAYARRGFFELVWVAMLGIPLLLGTRAAIGTDAGVRRRHTMLSVPLVVMLGAMIGSAALRMRLYVAYYGLTIERFYPLVFMGWLAVVLVLLAITVLREQGRFFVAGAALTGFAVLAALNIANPDAIIARVNVDRAATKLSRDAAGLDLVHLASLGGDAAGIAVTAVISATNADPRERCLAARQLLTRWGPSSPRAMKLSEPGAWRLWNNGERSGLAAVARSSAELQAVVRTTGCG